MKNKQYLKRLKVVWRFAKPYKFSFINVFVCILFTSFIAMFYPYIFGILIDEVFYHRNMEFFLLIVMGYGILYIGEQSLHFILNMLWPYQATRFLFDVRKVLYEKIISLKSSYLCNINTGDLIARINSDTNGFVELIHRNISYVLANTIRLIATVIFVGLINIKLAILMLIISSISFYVSIAISKKSKLKQKKLRDKYGVFISWISDILRGMRDIQLMAGERNITKQFINYCSNIIRLRVENSIIELISERVNSFISLISDLSLYILAGIFIIKGELTVGGFIAIISYFSNTNSLLNSINNYSIKIQGNFVTIDKVIDILDEEIEEGNTKLPDISVHKGGISFSNVHFSYNNENEVLKGINLNINEGERLSIIGKSGSGKSTMVNLLLRFYDPAKGEVMVDDINIRDCNLKSLRRNIGIVQQEALIFNGTIKYNLKLGSPKCTDSDIWDACEKAYIAEYINSLPDKLNSMIGPGGINLSGGQKQRIAIARIFLKNPKILIFDEATSALDYEAETAIQEAWKELSESRTSIVIAHRLSTILHSDRVAVLHDGKIVACDHHLNLLDSCGYYKELFKEQYLCQEEAAV